MKAAVVERPYQMSVKEVETPRPGAGEVVIRVTSAAVCASDLHSYHGQHPAKSPPVIPGHECAGVVEWVGAGVANLAPGTRVTVLPQRSCGVCLPCRQGAPNICDHRSAMGYPDWPGCFAEYVKAPASTVIPLPGGLPDDVGALVEPLAVSIHAVRRSGLRLGESLLVLGSGAIGLLAVLAARAAGASVIVATDVRPFSLRMARAMGATHTADARTEDVAALAREATGGQGAHRTILAADAPELLERAMDATRKRGTIVMAASMALPINVTMWVARRTEQQVVGCLAYEEEEFAKALALAGERTAELSSLVTHHFRLEEIHRAFELAQTRAEDFVRIMVHP